MSEKQKNPIYQNLKAILDSVSRGDDIGEKLKNDIKLDPKSRKYLYLGKSEESKIKIDEKALEQYNKSISAFIGLLVHIYEMNRKSKRGIKGVLTKVSDGLELSIAAISTVGSAISTEAWTGTPSGCKDALAVLQRRTRELAKKMLALLDCITEHAEDITFEDPLPDICSWEETEVKAAQANLKAASIDVQRECRFDFMF